MELASRWRPAFRCASICVFATALVLTIACGGKDDNGDNGGGGNNGGGSPVSNGSRLAWTQIASSLQQVQSMTFRLYVDDSPMALSGVSCSQSGSAYECAGQLPNMSGGRHVLQLASVLNGAESSRSDSITITINAVTTEVTTSDVSSNDSGSSAAPSSICLTEPRECYAVNVIASGLQDATSLTALADGRVLFIEGGSRVRLVADDTLDPVSALVSMDLDSRLVSLAVDRTSGGSVFVFVASNSVTGDGRSELNVTRYREVAGILGEGAPIITGLPFAKGTTAPMAVDAKGLLYLALPATATESHGTVLRFTRDGFVPDINWRGLPLIAEGYAQPSAMAIDTEHDRLWLAGTDPQWLSRVSGLSIRYSESFADNRLEPFDLQQTLPALDASLAMLAGGTRSSLLVGAGGQSVSGPIATNGSVNVLRPVESAPAVALGQAANGLHGKWYALSGSPESGVSLLGLSPLSR